MSTTLSIRSDKSAANGPSVSAESADLLCFSHLRWDFVYQRPQHLLSRAAQSRRVFYWEEPVFVESASPELSARKDGGVCVVRPLLPHGTAPDRVTELLRGLLERFVADQQIRQPIAWYYTPMALSFSESLDAGVVVYDCMDELSAFAGAPPELREREAELFRKADVVFTGGRSLYESKRGLHAQVELFPSSIDRAHFAAARQPQADPADQAQIPHPRVGFFGVLDERFDRALLREVAVLRPEIHFVIIGPVAKIRMEDLPTAPNVHYLGQKSYLQLPSYIAGWEAAMLPFALNEATAFISPTKTPEYLAAGKHVVSTPIRDVVRTYGDAGLAEIARTPEEFASALDRAIREPDSAWLNTVDEALANTSWDATWERMSSLVRKAFLHSQASASK